MRKFISGAIILILTAQPFCLAQSTLQHHDPAYYKSLQELADKNLRLGYGIGEGYEIGDLHATNMSDIDAALYWYKRAEKGLMHGGLYRIGLLLKQQRLLMKDKNGVLRPNSAQGQAFMEYAIQQGYDPVKDACCYKPPASSASTLTDSEKLGAAVVAGIVFLGLASLSSREGGNPRSDSSNGGANDSNEPIPTPILKTCALYKDVTVYDSKGIPSEQRQFDRTGYGYECP